MKLTIILKWVAAVSIVCLFVAVGYLSGKRDAAYLPDQDVFFKSIALGDGLRDLEHVSGQQGHRNTAVGMGAAFSLTTGKYNTLVGANSGRKMTADNVSTTYSPGANLGNHGNTFVGFNTAAAANGALDNTGIGVNVMLNLTTGMDNFAGGINALRDILGGSENVAMGHGALQHLAGDGTYEDGNGHRNTAVGDMAGRGLNNGEEKTGGKNSVYVGARTSGASNSVVNENVFGYEAKGRGSNTVAYGNDEITGHYFNGGPIVMPNYSVTTRAPNVYIDPDTGEIMLSTAE